MNSEEILTVLGGQVSESEECVRRAIVAMQSLVDLANGYVAELQQLLTSVAGLRDGIEGK